MSKITNFFIGRPLFWILLLFLVLPLLAFPEIIFGRQTLYWTDLSWIHYPRHIFAAEEWLAGRVPLWDPYEDTGIPLLAESQVGALYPFSVLFLSGLSPSLELSIFILLHFTLAGWFTYALARTLALSRPAAVVSGLVFGLGGFLMAQVPNLNIMTGAVWLPLILLAAIQALRRRTLLPAMLAGIPLALQILTAQPQIVFYSLVIAAAYGLYRLAADLRHGAGYALYTGLLISVVIASGLLLAAPQLAPTLELQELSVRSQERTLSFLTENSLPPAMWLNLLLPSAFGNNVTGFRGGDPFQEVFIYAGFIPLWLALLGLGGGQSRPQTHRLFFVLLLVGTAGLAMGSYTPLYELVIQHLPGFALFRIPSRWLMGVNLALAVLAGQGLERLLRQGLSRRGLAALLALWGLLAGAVILFGLYGAAWLDRYGPTLDEFYQRLAETFLEKGYRPAPIYRERLLLSWVSGLTAPAYLLLANTAIGAVLFSLFALGRLPARRFNSLLIAALSLDMVLAGGTAINPTKPVEWWQELSGGARFVLDNVGQYRVFPLGMGSEAAAVSHLGQYFPSVYRVRSAGGHGSSLRLARYDAFLHESDPVQAIQVLGVRYLLTLGQMGADTAATYPLAYSDANSFVYENKSPLPRAFIVHQTIRAGSSAEALAYFQSRDVGPGRTVVLETAAAAPDPAPLPEGSRSEAIIFSQTPQAVVIEARLAADGYLVLLDTFYPGWLATVDGQPSPIYRANTTGRAVFVPAGTHQIHFTYRPRSFQIGLLLSLLMLTGLTVTAVKKIFFTALPSSQ